MKAFIILAFAAIGYAAPAADPQLLQSGLPAGPLTPAWGDLVATPRGARPLHLEGFSEDVNQDGFVDPIGQAAVAVAAPAVYAHAPVVYNVPAVKPVEIKAVEVKPVEVKPVEIKAPVVTYAAAPAVYHHAPLAHTIVHQPVATHTYTVPVSTHTETVQVGTHVYTHNLPHVLGAGAPILGGLPVVAAAAPAEAAEEAVVAEE